jgi:hypothetical protein
MITQNRYFVGICTVIMALGAIITTATASQHHALDTVPCDIKLIFGTDNQGMSTVSYDLELQISNRTGRVISDISVYWLNATNYIIGNSDAACGHVTDTLNSQGIAPGETGACRRTVQTVGGRLLDRLGQETWTNIINAEMRNFKHVRHCAVIGYRFQKTSVKTY